MKLMEKLNRKTLLEKVMKTRPPAASLWQKRESILLFTGTGATVLLASHMSVEDILFTIRDLADVQQVLVDQLREQCGCCDKEGEKDKPLQRVEEEALQRERRTSWNICGSRASACGSLPENWNRMKRSSCDYGGICQWRM